MSMKKSLLLLGTVLLLAVILASCGGKPEPTSVPTEAPAPTVVPTPTIEVPNQVDWASSGDGGGDTEPFRQGGAATENPDGVPVTCAKCHTSAGYQDFLGAE